MEENYSFYITGGRLPIVDRAQGIRIWDTDQKEYIDACSGAIICSIGYGQSAVVEAVVQQAKQTFFAYRLHFDNQPAQDYSRMLVSLSASHLERVFFVSGGSEAVESAMKLCRQYFYDRGEGSRYVFISRTPSYHGGSLATLSLTSYAPLEAPFRPLLYGFPKIPAPYCYRCAYHLTYPDCGVACAKALEKTILETGPDNVAAFVAEPIGGASTGGLVPPEEYFDIIRRICTQYGVMLILDEVMTGFGRTGRLFGYQHWDIEADIVALSKGMASGYFPLGAIMTRRAIVDSIMESGGFKHGFTYCGNPMSCAVGLQVLNIIQEQDLCGNADRMGRNLKALLEQLAASFPIIGQVRGRGLLLGLELVRNSETREPFPAEANAAQCLTDTAFELGLIVYPRRSINGLRGDHVLVAPPLIIDESETVEVVDRLRSALSLTTERLEKFLT